MIILNCVMNMPKDIFAQSNLNAYKTVLEIKELF